MRIAVIGAGAMGSIYGSLLSVGNDLILIDKNKELVDTINENGLSIETDGTVNKYSVRAITDSENEEEVDLVILFVKALYSRAALSENLGIIGENTYVLSLQNGGGHHDIISEFVDEGRIISGTTEDNGSMVKPAYVRKGGNGVCNIGMMSNDSQDALEKIKNIFDKAGFECRIHENINGLIWDKLFTNISLSVVTAILQVKMGYITENNYAWNMCEMLVDEAYDVSEAMGLRFDKDKIYAKVRKASEKSPNGITSIANDIKYGRRTEVETISGYVLRMAEKYNVDVPMNKFVVSVIHAMENRKKFEI